MSREERGGFESTLTRIIVGFDIYQTIGATTRDIHVATYLLISVERTLLNQATFFLLGICVFHGSSPTISIRNKSNENYLSQENRKNNDTAEDINNV